MWFCAIPRQSTADRALQERGIAQKPGWTKPRIKRGGLWGLSPADGLGEKATLVQGDAPVSHDRMLAAAPASRLRTSRVSSATPFARTRGDRALK